MSRLPVRKGNLPILLREVTHSALLGVGACIAPVMGILDAGFTGAAAVPSILLAVLGGGHLAKAVGAHQKDKQSDEARKLADLEACLRVLHASVLAMRGRPYVESEIQTLRLTIHRVENDHHIKQLLPYVGGGDGGADRVFSNRSGIVGQALLSGKPQGMIRTGSLEEYQADLVAKYFMPHEEAQRVSTDRFGFLAVPLAGKGPTPIGVVWMDTTDAKLFADASNGDIVCPKLMAQVFTACGGIAQHLSVHYSKGG